MISILSMIWAGTDETSAKLLDRLLSDTPSTKIWEKNGLPLWMKVNAVMPGPPLCWSWMPGMVSRMSASVWALSSSISSAVMTVTFSAVCESGFGIRVAFACDSSHAEKSSWESVSAMSSSPHEIAGVSQVVTQMIRKSARRLCKGLIKSMAYSVHFINRLEDALSRYFY